MRSAWPQIVIAGAALFLARGIALLSILPPFEGWDEGQHIAYIQYVAEHHAAPVQGSSVVPVSLAPLFLSYPHPDSALERRAFDGIDGGTVCATNKAGILMQPMMKAWGAMNYSSFWARAKAPVPLPATKDLPSVALYQAQHPPWYYVAAAPVWQAIAPRNPLLAIAVLRALNLLLGALTIVVIGFMLGAVVPDLACRAAAFAVIVLQPLSLLNVARVGNDALAVLLGTAAVALLATATARRFALRMGIAAALTALGVLVKEVTLTLVPLLPVALLVQAWRFGLPRGATVRAGIVMLVLFAAITAWPFYQNYRQYGSFTSVQGRHLMQKRGISSLALLREIPRIDWMAHVRFVLLPGTAWVGGWSLLKPPRFLRDGNRNIMLAGALCAAAGMLLVVCRAATRRRPLVCVSRHLCASWPPMFIFACGAGLVFAGICYHVLVYKVTKNIEVSAAWHFALALPFWLLVVMQAVQLAARRVLLVFATALACCFWLTELAATLGVMIPFYTSSAAPSVMFQRLAALHPVLLHPVVLPVALLCSFVCAVTATVSFVRAVYLPPGGEDTNHLA